MPAWRSTARSRAIIITITVITIITTIITTIIITIIIIIITTIIIITIIIIIIRNIIIINNIYFNLFPAILQPKSMITIPGIPDSPTHAMCSWQRGGFREAYGDPPRCSRLLELPKAF